MRRLPIFGDASASASSTSRHEASTRSTPRHAPPRHATPRFGSTCPSNVRRVAKGQGSLGWNERLCSASTAKAGQGGVGGEYGLVTLSLDVSLRREDLEGRLTNHRKNGRVLLLQLPLDLEAYNSHQIKEYASFKVRRLYDKGKP